MRKIDRKPLSGLIAPTSRSLMMTVATVSFILSMYPTPASAIDSKATPTGENVVSGNASFNRPSEGRLTVNQSSDRAIINWGSFNIGKTARAEFHQPGASSLTVNRVVNSGTDPTQILGTLKSNGRLMVLDSNGILFGPNSVVDVGGIIASTGDIDDSAVIGGSNEIVLNNLGNGTINLRGKVDVSDAGLAAFVAPTVKNSGVISAKLGRVELASGGSQATVDFYGDNLIQLAPGGNTEQALIENSGHIEAESGTVAMTTGFATGLVDSLINMSGVVDVSSVTRDGGRIILRSVDGNFKNSSRLKAESERRRGGDVNLQFRELRIDGRISTSGEDGAGNIEVGGGGGGILYGRSARLDANSTRGKGGIIDTGADGGPLVLNGVFSSSGRTGGGDINLENGDDAVTVNRSGQILSEARDSGSAGNIDISSAEGTQVIAGRILSVGQRGGDISVRSRSGINVTNNGLLESHSVGSSRGGDIELLVGEGEINHDGRIVSNGRTGGGKINLRGTDLNIKSGSLIESSSTGSGRGGVVTVEGSNIDADGTIDVTGQQGGGNISFNAFQDIEVSGELTADARKTGNGGRVTLNSSEGVVIFSGDISARGGSQSGNGGRVTFSKPNIIRPSSSVDVSAPNGDDGKFTH